MRLFCGGGTEKLVAFASKSVLVAAIAVALLAGISVWAQTPRRAPQRAAAGNAQNGKQLFTSRKCFSCHGPDAKGGVGPSLVPPGLVFADFVNYVRKPAGQMLPFTKAEVPDRDLTDIYAFLKASAPPAGASAPALSAIAGNAQNGKKIFASYGCYECHGYEGQGSIQTGTPVIGPPALSITAFANYVHQPTANMPPYTSKVVSDSDIADIYSFLKSIPPASAKNIPLLKN